MRTIPLSATALVLSLTACVGLADAQQSEVPPPAPAAARSPVNDLADEWLRDLLANQPLLTLFLGMPGGRHDGLGDNSLAAVKAWEAREDALLARVRAIDVGSVAPRDQATHGMLLELLEGSVQGRVCREELWPLNQQSGLQVSLPVISQLQPVGTEAQRRDALARWRAMPRYIDTEIANLREGLRQGYTLPRSNVAAIVEQLDELVKIPVPASPLAAIAARDPAPGFKEAIHEVVARDIVPAFGRYRHFLKTDYLPKARLETSVSALPNGRECYRARVRRYATVDMAAADVHRLGLEQMAALEQQMRALGPRTVGTDDLATIVQRLRTDPQYKFRTREEMIEVTERAVERARAAMPRFITRVPKTAFIVAPCEPFEEKSGCPGSYIPGDAETKRPGRFRLNAGDPTSQPRITAEGTAFHEGIPGHHFQIALAQEREGAHAITRYFPLSGFAEGWALYAERVADEMGLYSSDLDRLGDLNEQALRAARLVVDPGLHVLGWSRQQAIDYMKAHLVYPESYLTSEVDRYIADPGQATAYMIGRLEIERLRAEATARRGDRFSLPEFHDRVLENGGVPLMFLRSHIERWLSQP
jgi:uncharacterized protein (DUF885 family)